MPRPASPGRVTEPYGPRAVRPTPTSPLFHYGEDRGWGNGTAITAPEAGVVVQARYSGAYGNRLILRTRSADWWLCHMSSFAIGEGQPVSEGDYLGEMGSTGNVTATHLHTEHRIDAGAPGTGTHTNPADYYTGAAGSGLTPIGDDMPLSDQDIDRLTFHVWQRPYPNLDGGATVPVIEYIRQLDAKTATNADILGKLKALLLDETTNVGGGKARVIDMWRMTDHRVEELEKRGTSGPIGQAGIKALAAALAAELGDDLATGADVDELEDRLTKLIEALPEENLKALGLQRIQS